MKVKARGFEKDKKKLLKKRKTLWARQEKDFADSARIN